MPRKKRTKMINGAPYLSTGQAAEKFGVSKNTMLKLCSIGRVMHIKIGRACFFTEKWLDELQQDLTRDYTYNQGAKKK